MKVYYLTAEKGLTGKIAVANMPNHHIQVNGKNGIIFVKDDESDCVSISSAKNICIQELELKSEEEIRADERAKTVQDIKEKMYAYLGVDEDGKQRNL